jgi:UDP-N-acetylmuramate-alanine ligase
VQGSDQSDSANVEAPRRDSASAVAVGHRAENLGEADVVVDVDGREDRQSGSAGRARATLICRSCAAPRCWPS